MRYTKERRQFGHAVADFQGVQFQLARAATDVEAARLLVYNAARRRDAGEPFLTEAAMCKLFASEAATRACNKALQIHAEEAARDDELRQALARGELALHWQPIVDAQTWQVRGVEALLRWEHPTLGTVSPAEFVPVAEKAGLIGEVGAWVFGQACRVARAHLPGLVVSINVSPLQLMRDAFADEVATALRESGLDPRWIELPQVWDMTRSALLVPITYGDAALGVLSVFVLTSIYQKKKDM